MKKLAKHLLSLMVVAVMFVPVFQANAALNLFGDDSVKNNIQKETGLAVYDANVNDPRVIAAKIINFLLGFLGIVAVVIILIAGFKWMTAGGDSKAIDEAKGLMKNGVIGLIIVLSSWAIANFVIDELLKVTGNAG